MNQQKPGSISRRQFVGTAVASTLLTVGGSSFLSAVAARPRRPNVLFILTDDLGWGDLSIYGQTNYQTPNLDRLASEGARFTNAYAAQTVCTPTRIAFFTGRYPARLPVGINEPLDNIERIDDSVGLPADHPTIASLLKANGYETALVGKWHGGYPPAYGPWQNGFDEYFGNLSGGIDYFRHVDADAQLDLWEGKVQGESISYGQVTQDGYVTDLYTQRAVEFINRPRDRPFYLSLHYNTPHWPWQGPNDKAFSDSLVGTDSFANWTNLNGSPEVYAAMMQSLDDAIGKVLQALSDSGQAENTIVIFTSDNGGERYSNFELFQGRKGNLYEGGLRVPAIIRWPGVARPNLVSSQAIITMDLTATILAATGTQGDRNYPLDGLNLFPFLRNPRLVNPRSLFWRYLGYPFNTNRQTLQKAVRYGYWKYLSVGENEYLFDLSKDSGEITDLKNQYSSVFQALRSQFQQWDAQVLPYPT